MSRYRADPIYREHVKAQMRAYYGRHRERIKARWNARRDAAADRPRPDQCEACGAQSDSRALAWDHIHKTGQFRGWLCSRCNLILGQFADDPTVLKQLVAYLEKANAKQVEGASQTHGGSGSRLGATRPQAYPEEGGHRIPQR